ncbi:sensor histidine kinase [Paraflavitalea pollutisoli]|uniref:sensor histidine kinase n=1 Tax=Paraflavitalea pollutisoli TaxID=3034143 RepID=UPI0023EC80DB|nr:histidine kinase [Paraflavitalea sp. H1-2-19X]
MTPYRTTKSSRRYGVLWCCLVGALPLIAQQPAEIFGQHILFQLNTITTQARMQEAIYVRVPDTALYQVFDHLQAGPREGVVKNSPNSPLILGVKLNPTLTNYFGNPVSSVTRDFHSYRIQDSSEAALLALGITPENAGDYRYHVVANDSVELVPWSPVTQLEQRHGARKPYALIGKFRYPGKTVLVEVVNTKNYASRDGVLFDWQTDLRPVLRQITLQMPRDYFNLAYLARNRGYATRFDRLTHIPLDFSFPADSVLQVTVELERRPTVAYIAYLLRHTARHRDTLDVGFVNPHGQITINASWYREPGNYELRIEPMARWPVWDPARMLTLPFTVLPATRQGRYVSEKVLLAWLSGFVALAILVFLGYRRYSRGRLQQEATRSLQAQLRLKALRAQLNPHFLFNALGSIQNLVNKQNLLQANQFLARFARLTRKVLQSSEEDLVSLEDELQLSVDYLQMEQLRFGFEYTCTLDPAIVPANVELPALLLQPFLENAVRHGVSALQTAGRISINVKPDHHHLVISISDNGRGMAAAEPLRAGAFGLKLSEERIALVNQLYPTQPVILQVDSTPAGTTVQLTLTNWL